MRAAAGLALVLALVVVAGAHPGGTDANGGHVCRTNCKDWGLEPGQYHTHGGSGGSSDGALAVLVVASFAVVAWLGTRKR